MPVDHQLQNVFSAPPSSGGSATIDTLLQGLRGWMMPDTAGTTPLVMFDVMSGPIGTQLRIAAAAAEATNLRITTQALPNGQGLVDSNNGPTTSIGTIKFQKWRVAQGGSFVPGEFMFIGLTDANLHAVFLNMPPTGAQSTIGFLIAAPPQANIIAISGDGSGVAASADTGVSVDTAFHTFEIVFAGAAGVANLATFYIDGVQVCQINVNIPAPGTLVGAVFYGQGNARTMFFEYMYLGLKN